MLVDQIEKKKIKEYWGR